MLTVTTGVTAGSKHELSRPASAVWKGYNTFAEFTTDMQGDECCEVNVWDFFVSFCFAVIKLNVQSLN